MNIIILLEKKTPSKSVCSVRHVQIRVNLVTLGWGVGVGGGRGGGGRLTKLENKY